MIHNFDLYIKSDEAITTNDSLYYEYHQLLVISQMSDIDLTILDDEIFSVV